ncbi:3'5'-cyclic nucleotide phosphodiesterase [Haematococcus lacustris]
MFELEAATHGRPLSTLAYFLMSSTGLLATFKLPGVKVARFLRAVEAGYRPNPYHNKVHAADVLQTLHVVLTKGGVLAAIPSPLTHLACYVAAVSHDYEHVGLNNDFLINTNDQLARIYNDKSPMENHHLAAMFGLLRQDELNFVAQLPKAELVQLRQMVIELVLATDMKQHFAAVSHFMALYRLAPLRGPVHDLIAITLAPPPPPPAPPPIALKLSDLGHLAEELHVHSRWVSALEEELYRQGDREKAAGLPISPLFDRTKPGVSKSQVGFMDFVVVPLFHSFVRAFPSTQPMFHQLALNYRHWETQRWCRALRAPDPMAISTA